MPWCHGNDFISHQFPLKRVHLTGLVGLCHRSCWQGKADGLTLTWK